MTNQQPQEQTSLVDLALTIMKVVGQSEDYKTEAVHYRNLYEQERQKNEVIQQRAQALMSAFNPVTCQPG